MEGWVVDMLSVKEKRLGNPAHSAIESNTSNEIPANENKNAEGRVRRPLSASLSELFAPFETSEGDFGTRLETDLHISALL